MLLEGLGVPYETFKKYQDAAVQNAHDSKDSLERSAYFLESHGLGSAFRIPSVLTSLSKLGVFIDTDVLAYDKVMDFGINHVLRLLKHRGEFDLSRSPLQTLLISAFYQLAFLFQVPGT